MAAAIDDVVGVVKWVTNRPEPLGAFVGPTTLVGDSSAGAIVVPAAAALARRPIALAALILVCPNADLTLAGLTPLTPRDFVGLTTRPGDRVGVPGSGRDEGLPRWNLRIDAVP